MTNEEIYDKFFIDEEYELENVPTDTYSYCSGWNNALKRASIVIRDEIRPHGKWIIVKQDFDGIHEIECPFCKYNKGSDFNAFITVTFDRLPPFCENCGARMETDNE